MALTQLSAYTRDAIIMDKIGVEGGAKLTDIPQDRGGATVFGITAATAQAYHDQLVAQFQWDGLMAHLTVGMAIYIYINEYWNKMDLDAIWGSCTYGPLVADLMFEAGINLGWKLIAQWFQTILNVLNNQQAYYRDLVVDGNIGSVTVSAFRALVASRPDDGLANVLFMLSAKAGSRYIDIAVNNPSQETFESGWENRARNQYDTYVRMNAA